MRNTKGKIFQAMPIRGKRIRCPICGKLGVLHKYKDENFDMVLHTYKYELGLCNVIDRCFLEKT